MKNSILLSVLAASLLVSCQPKQNTTHPTEVLDTTVTYPLTVDLNRALALQDSSIRLSTFVDSISYIPLRLPDDLFFQVGATFLYDETAKLFFVAGLYNIISVDMQGHLVSRIGKRGQGPGEYVQVSTISLDPSKREMYVQDALGWTMQKFDYQGHFLKQMFKIDTSHKMTAHLQYDKDNFVTDGEPYHWTYGKHQNLLYGFGVMDTTGTKWLDMTAPQLAQIKTDESEHLAQFMSKYVNRNAGTPLLSIFGFCDTVFTVKDNKIVPRYFLDYGKERPNLKELWSMNAADRQAAASKTFFMWSPAFETKRYFLIEFRKNDEQYVLCYDKYKHTNASLRYDREGMPDDFISDFKNDLTTTSIAFGLKNDIDGGIDSFPVSVSTDGNYWISYVTAEDMKNILTDAYFAKRTNVKDKAQQEKLKQLVKSLKNDDNPVLILMKLKKGI
jgi:hypothetical protein